MNFKANTFFLLSISDVYTLYRHTVHKLSNITTKILGQSMVNKKGDRTIADQKMQKWTQPRNAVAENNGKYIKYADWGSVTSFVRFCMGSDEIFPLCYTYFQFVHLVFDEVIKK